MYNIFKFNFLELCFLSIMKTLIHYKQANKLLRYLYLISKLMKNLLCGTNI